MSGPKEAPERIWAKFSDQNAILLDWSSTPETDMEAYTRHDICEGLAKALKPKHSPLPAHPHSQREEAFAEMLARLKHADLWLAGIEASEEMRGHIQLTIALAESCK